MSKNAAKVNPLASLLRQPKVYISLPSGGKYWPDDSISKTLNNEYPVFSMTARDEIMLKTPDALMNGQAVIDVIHSCMPNITNAWDAPQIDLDVILVAIRMATYGDTMSLEVNHSTMDGEMDFQINLREVLDQLQAKITWEERFEVNPNLVVYIKPLDYRTYSTSQIAQFETERMMMIIRNEDLDEETKLKAFKETFEKLTTRTMDLVHKAVFKVESSVGTTDEEEFVQEFMKNCDAEIFEKIKNRIAEMSQNNNLPAMKFKSTPEMIEKGAPEEIEVPFTFDASNFFE